MKRPIFKEIILVLAIFSAILAMPKIVNFFSKSRSDKFASAQASMPSPRYGETASSTPRAPEKAVAAGSLQVNGAEQTVCPEQWVVGQRTREGAVSVARDKLLLEAPYQNLITVVPIVFDGREGVDTLKVPAGGYINVDGARVISLEIFRMQNGRMNVVNVLAPGLATMEENHFVVYGDADMDVVYLDGCLKWDHPVRIGNNGFLRYVAHDKQGNTATVDITMGVVVRSLSPKRIAEWLQPVTALRENENAPDQGQMHPRDLTQRTQQQGAANPSSEITPVFKETLPNNSVDAKGKVHIVGWGNNSIGQLGTGLPEEDGFVPQISVKVEEILKPNYQVLQLASSLFSFCLLRSDKSVWCWGGDSFLDADPYSPMKIEGLPPIKALISSSGQKTCATTDNDQAWCWEGNRSAERFNPGWASSPELQNLALSFSQVSLSADSGCGLTVKGDVWCWGARNGAFPSQVKLPQPALQVSAGAWQTCALLSDRTAWCWQSNSDAGNAFDVKDKFKQVVAGTGKYCGIKDEGKVTCLNGGKRIEISPGRPLSEAIKIAQSGEHVCTLLKNGTVWCWDAVGFGDPSLGGLKDYAIQVRGPDPSYFLDHVKDIAVSGYSAIAVVKDRDYKLAEETDSSKVFYALVYNGKFRAAKQYYSQMKRPLQKDAPLAQAALLRAIEFRQADVVKAIAETGINLELPGQFRTALWMTIRNYGDADPDIVRILLAYGAKATVIGPEGDKTPLEWLRGRPGPENNEAINLIDVYLKSGQMLPQSEKDRLQKISMGYSRDPFAGSRSPFQARRHHRPVDVTSSIPGAPSGVARVSDKPPPNPVHIPAVADGAKTAEVTSLAASPVPAVNATQAAVKSLPAFVRQCQSVSGKPDIHDYPVIFKGRVKSVDASGKTVFDVSQTYKGDLGASIDVYPSDEKSGKQFELGEEDIVFATRSNGRDPWGPECTPIYHLKGLGENMPATTAEMLVDLEMFNSKIKVTEFFKKEYHTDISYYVMHKDAVDVASMGSAANLLDEYRDYERSAKAYAALLANAAAQHGQPSQGSCPESNAPNGASTEFLNFAGGIEPLLVGYGRALFKTGRYAEALRPLCLAAGASNRNAPPDAAAWEILTLVKLGKASDIGPGPFDFSRVASSVDEIDLTGAHLRYSNFSNTKLKHLIIRDADLTGANFENSKIDKLDVYRSKLEFANFRNMTASGSMEDAEVSASFFQCARLTLESVKNSYFVNADFSGANLQVKKIIGTDLPQLNNSADSAAACQRETNEAMTETGRPQPRPLKLQKISNLPANVEVLGVGTYSAEGNSQNVFVGQTGAPIVLVLTAYDPTMWNLHLENGVNLQAVIIGGYGHQDISGLPRGTRVFNFSPTPGIGYNGFSSSNFAVFDDDRSQAATMESTVMAITGKSITNFKKMESHGDIYIPEEDRLAALKKRAAQGDGAAQKNLADRYYFGDGIEQNYKMAAKLYQSAAEQGDLDAGQKLSSMFVFGQGVKQDPVQAQRWGSGSDTKTQQLNKMRRDAQGGDRNAQGRLGFTYLSGLGAEVNFTEAYFWLLVSKAEQWQILQAKSHLSPQQISEVEARVSNWRPSAAPPVDLPATPNMDSFLAKAKAGDPEAQYNLSCLLLDGMGVVNPDPAAAFKWLRAAAEQKYSKAEDRLADMYSRGMVDNKPNNEEGVKWYLRAAEHGNPDAQYVVGGYYYGGVNVKKNDAEAVKWYLKAAEQGYFQAQSDLGVFYATGIGVPKDNREAYFWLSLAAKGQGIDNDQTSMRDGVGHQLTKEEVSAVNERLKNWKPSGQD